MIDLAAGTAFDGRGPILILLFPAIFLIHTGKNTFFPTKICSFKKKVVILQPKWSVKFISTIYKYNYTPKSTSL